MTRLDRALAALERSATDERVRARVVRLFGTGSGVYARHQIPAWLDTDGKALVDQMRDAAADLAGRIDAGLMDRPDRDMLCDLRGLSLAMADWAEQVEALVALGAASISRRPSRLRRRWLARVVGWFTDRRKVAAFERRMSGDSP